MVTIESAALRLADCVELRHELHTSRSVYEIKPVLKREWKRVANGDLKNPLLTTIATAISEWIKIDFNVEM